MSARLVWQFGEPVHAVTYYAPEVRAATDALGLKGGWMSYFACRAAPLGDASAAVVTAAFFNFHPTMVERAIPDAWSLASSSAVLEARWSAMDLALRRLLGDADVGRAAALARAAVESGSFDGRVLGRANAALTPPDEPRVSLWQSLCALREHRGDGHVHVLVSRGIAPCEALVLQAATGRSPADRLQLNRGWSDDEWRAATESLVARGWLTADGAISDAGARVRDEIERETDRLAASAVRGLGDARTAELVDALRPLAHAVMDAGEVPASNNMGVPWPPEG